MWQIWLIASGIFFICEIITVGFLVFWLGVGALIAMLVSFFTSNIIIQMSVFVVSSGLLIFATRPLVNKISKKDVVPTNVYSLIGKKAIVTGASGGIGYALVKGMVEAGIEVAMLDYSESLEQIRDELSALGKVYAFRCDLTDRKNRELIFDQAVEALGGTLAGVQKRGLLIEFKDEDWDFIMEVNINAVFAMTRSAGKYMIPQRSGKIINMASMNSYFGGTNVPPYASSKGAVVQFTKAVANEWSKYGINANAIAPGFIETPMTLDMKENPEVYEYKRGRIPKGRWGKPDDLVGTLLYLCSDASDYVCGVTIPVDGGYLCK